MVLPIFQTFARLFFARLFFGCAFILTLLSCTKQVDGAPTDPVPEVPASGHPFLIVNKSEFEMLRARSDKEPWQSIMEDAIKRSDAGSSNNAYDLQDYIGAAALAYILEPTRANLHASRVRDAIIDQYSQLKVEDGGSWGGVVPNLGSFFMAILSLDIVYDALDSTEIGQCEKIISDQIFKIDRIGSWQDVRYGTHGTWDIYVGDRTSADNDYYDGIMKQITPDGVSPVTIHYAWERVGGGDSRLSKAGYMDVLEYTGIDPRYYDNQRLQKFQRWLFGSSVNCSKEMAIIGDMLPTQSVHNDMLHRRVGNFDTEAAGYAAWFHAGVKAQGNILTYILPKDELPDPVVPSSKWYENGGAFFRERADNPAGLHLVLYNIKSQDEWHTHNEVNGLALSGYGNRLLVNGGRLGAPTREAKLNNTLTINGVNHASRLGKGILEGFTTDQLDYASGDAGGALPGKRHLRNAILVHGNDEVKPYCVLFDEVKAFQGDEIRNYLHPANQSNIIIEEADSRFLATIDHYPTVSGSSLTFFYATPPSSIEIEKVPSAVENRYPGYPEHNRLTSVYATDQEGKKQMITILYPKDQSFTLPAMERISGDYLTGCLIHHESGVKDLIIESTGVDTAEYSSLSFRGRAVISRFSEDLQSFYFVRKGTSFRHNDGGFESDNPITIYAYTKGGMIISDGGQTRLHGIDASTITFEPSATVEELSDDEIKVTLSPGTYGYTY